MNNKLVCDDLEKIAIEFKKYVHKHKFGENKIEDNEYMKEFLEQKKSESNKPLSYSFYYEEYFFNNQHQIQLTVYLGMPLEDQVIMFKIK